MKQLVTVTLLGALVAGTASAQSAGFAHHVERLDTPLLSVDPAYGFVERPGGAIGDLQLATISVLRHGTLAGGPVAPVEGTLPLHPLPPLYDHGAIVAPAPSLLAHAVEGPFTLIGRRPFADYVQVSITEIGIERSLATYGCGTNPAGSLVLLEGTPAVGETIVFGVRNPLGTQPAGSFAFLALSSRPDAAFPCGSTLPGAGMGGPGSAGELLIDVSDPNPFLVVGPERLDAPTATARMTVRIPDAPTLAGMEVYAQGAVLDPFALEGVTLGLTTAARVTLGS